MGDREASGIVTLAEINLRYVGEVVSRIRIGAQGIVYVVDGGDHVVAIPDVAVVLGKTSSSEYEPLRRVARCRARAPARGGGQCSPRARLDGSEVMISAAPSPRPSGWWSPSSPAARCWAAFTARLPRTLRPC
jgi:hypothetical protein